MLYCCYEAQAAEGIFTCVRQSGKRIINSLILLYFCLPVSMRLSRCTTTRLVLECIIYSFRFKHSGTVRTNEQFCLCLGSCEALRCQVMFKRRQHELHVGCRLSNFLVTQMSLQETVNILKPLFLIKVTAYISPADLLFVEQQLFFFCSKRFKLQ